MQNDMKVGSNNKKTFIIFNRLNELKVYNSSPVIDTSDLLLNLLTARIRFELFECETHIYGFVGASANLYLHNSPSDPASLCTHRSDVL